MEKYRITKQVAEAARSYVPSFAKQAVIDEADKVMNGVEIRYGEDPLPGMCAIDPLKVERLMMGALAKLYFSWEIDTEDGSDYLLTGNCYDAIAEEFPIKELEALRSDNALRDKAVRILEDFYTLKRCVISEARDLQAVRNDYVVRMSQYTENQLKEQLPSILYTLREMQNGQAVIGGGQG